MTKRTLAKTITQQSQLLNKENILEFLSHYYNYLSREQWQEIIIDGQVRVNTIVINVGYQLQIDDKLECTISFVEPKVNRKFAIILEEEDFLIINKPANLPIHPSGCFYKHTLWYLLTQGKANDYHFINRLDRETSGLVIVSKNKQATKVLSKQILAQEIQKSYYALVEGIFPREKVHLKGYLFQNPKQGLVRKKYYFSLNKLLDSKYAETQFNLLETKNNLSLIYCTPKTGRTHQIRASLEFLGFPLVGDKIYGKDERYFLKFLNDELTEEDYSDLRLPFQALQCYAYNFFHPSTKEQINCSIALDELIGDLFNL